MSNLEFLNMNKNESVDVPTEDSVNNSKGNFNKAKKNIKSHAVNIKENSDVSMIAKEDTNQKALFELCENMSSVSENNSNLLTVKETSSNGTNANFSDAHKDKFLKNILTFENKEKNQVSEATNDMISFPKGNIAIRGNVIDNKNISAANSGRPINIECISPSVAENSKNTLELKDDANHEAQENNFPLSYLLNIVPNPSEFSLLEKKNATLQNSDFPSVNQSANELLAFSDNSIVISNSNAIPQSDSIVSSNYSLSQLQQYISDDDDDDNEDCVIEELPIDPQRYRDENHQMEDSDDDTDSSTSSSSSIVISDTSSDSESEYENDKSHKPACQSVKAKGEMDLCDLPPIEDLTISVPEEECLPIGKIFQIVDQLVIVQANKDTPAYDLDTVLFTQGGKPLGKVFDVMGPVTEPYYCIRFNSKDHIQEKNITLDQTVYAAPKTEYSKFVFLSQLMQLKGSDASWENDIEPPVIYLDYSDDEQEQRAKKKNSKAKKAAAKTDCDPDEPARKRHSAYEKRMNARNLRLTASRNNQNSKSRADENPLWQPNLPSMMSASPPPPRMGTGCHQMFGRPPMFEPRVPLSSSPFPQFHRPEFLPYSMFAGPSTSSHSRGPPPPPQPCISPRPPPPFGRPCFTPGPSNSPRMSTFSPPPPYSRLLSNQGFPSTPPGWNSPHPNLDNPWANPNPFPPPRPMNGPPPMRIPTHPTFEMLPSSPGPFPMRGSSPQGPPPPRPAYNNRSNSFLQYTINRHAPQPPHSSNFFQN